MIDNYSQDLNILNLAFTLLSGLFISGVYGYAIEFLYNEFFNQKNRVDEAKYSYHNRLALIIGFTLGIITAIASYWETANSLYHMSRISFVVYSLSVFPVLFRAPLFIKSTYNLTKSFLEFFSKKQKISFKKILFIILLLMFSLFTIGGYSDISYNGMTQSTIYTYRIFHYIIYPVIITIVAFCMLLLNAEALLSVSYKLRSYFFKRNI